MPGIEGDLSVVGYFFSVFLRQDAWSDLLFGQRVSDFVAVISAITDQGFDLWQILEQNIHPPEIAVLAFDQVRPDGPPEIVTQAVQLCN